MEKRNEVRLINEMERKTSFREVSLGFDYDSAIREANRCLNCANPGCIKGCPNNVNIPLFIKQFKEGNIKEAYATILNDSALPRICSRVCQQENQCEGSCNLKKLGSVNIGALERYVSDNCTNPIVEINEKQDKVAIIGSGPSGLSCAYHLRKKGYQVTVFEALNVLGGVLTYGIPNFRLDNEVVNSEIEKIRNMGVEFVKNCKVSDVEEIKKLGYKAIYVCSGANVASLMNIPNEDAENVFTSYDFLYQVNTNSLLTDFKNKKAVVVGGGNSAVDVSRCLIRLGCKDVTIVYRRSLEELPAFKKEVQDAVGEGVNMQLLTNPICINKKDDKVKSISCVKMQLTDPDESGRRKPVPIANSEFNIETDIVIMAIGYKTEKLDEKIKTNQRGCIETNNDLLTNIDGVFAGGDVVSGASTVSKATRDGYNASISIDKYLQNK